MPLTNAYRDYVASVTAGQTVTAFDNANSYVGVGDGTTAFAVTQTDLQGSNNLRKSMDSSYPTVNLNVLTFRATFGTSDANFDWNEWGVFNASSAGVMLNRKVESLGTKPNTQTWQFTVTLTLNAA